MRMSHRLLNKYLFLFNVGGLLYILIELIWRGRSHWTMFLLGGICFVFLGLINEVMAADPHRCGRNHDIRVPDRLHRQSVARLGSLGLQRASGQPLGADLSAVLSSVAAGGTGRDRPGRLDPVLEIRRRTTALQTDLTDKHTI